MWIPNNGRDALIAFVVMIIIVLVAKCHGYI